MKKISSLFALLALSITTVAWGGQDKEEMVLKLAVDDGSASDEVTIRMDSATDGFRLHDLAEGESRSLVAEDGRPVLVTRSGDELVFNVDGRDIKVPAVPGGHEGNVEIHRMHGDMTAHGPGVRKMRRMEMRHAGDDGATIITGKTLDDATRASLEAALAAAGITDVRIIDGSELGADEDGAEVREVRIIKKEVHATN